MNQPKTIIGRMLATAFIALSALGASAQGPNGSGTYYQAADGKSGAQLKTQLSQIIYNRSERTYSQLWTDFQTTDAKPNGKVWDMYSNKREFTFGTDQAGNYKSEGDVYNREHSWPNSWFGGQIQPMYTDLHHLYPTDGYVNNKRGNHPFGETSGEKAGKVNGYKSANDFSKLGKCTYPGYDGAVFEPNDEYKGDFARTYFYMVTCYEEKIVDWYTNYGVNNNDNGKADTKTAVMATLDGNTYPGLTAWQLKMLLEWAAKDPVSDKETSRNNAVYQIQQNRNPFIDYPGLEQYIWGDKQQTAFSYDNYAQPAAIQQHRSDGENAANAVFRTLDGRRLDGQPQRRGVYIKGRHKVVLGGR